MRNRTQQGKSKSTPGKKGGGSCIDFTGKLEGTASAEPHPSEKINFVDGQKT